MTPKTVVLVHGNFVSYHSWSPWVRRYEERGYRVIAIPYPLRDRPVEELRRIHPDPALGKLTITEVLDHHIRIIRGLDELPIVIGHSFGGLLTQMLVNRGFAAAAVAIDSVPPMGVLTSKLSFFRSTFPALNPFPFPSRPYLMSFKHFQYTFVNGMTPDEQRRAYDSSVVPESSRLSRGGLTPKARIDFKKPHPPLLFIAGEIDHIMPAALNRVNFKRYKQSSGSITEFKEFPGRNHYLIGAKGWEEIADYAITWAEKQTASISADGRGTKAQVAAAR